MVKKPETKMLIEMAQKAMEKAVMKTVVRTNRSTLRRSSWLRSM